MTEKNIQRISIISVIILVIGTMIFKAIPEYKESIGSSDNFIFASNYEDMVEFKINRLNFAVITNQNKIIHILFFTKESLIFYNKDIENKSLEESINIIVNILVNTKNILNNDQIIITRYEDKSYTKIKQLLKEELSKYNYAITLTEKTSTLEERALKENISVTKKENIIMQLDLYSKEIISKYKNTSNVDVSTEKTNLTEKIAKENANKVYKKLQNYVITNNIGVQDINDTKLPITLIPADQTLNLYPSPRSWYYVENGKVYAYIEFETNEIKYGFCYQGSIEENKKGEC